MAGDLIKNNHPPEFEKKIGEKKMATGGFHDIFLSSIFFSAADSSVLAGGRLKSGDESPHSKKEGKAEMRNIRQRGENSDDAEMRILVQYMELRRRRSAQLGATTQGVAQIEEGDRIRRIGGRSRP